MNWLLLFLIFWCYRQIGVLRYQIDSARSDYDSSNVNFLSVPNLGAYLLWKYVTNRFFVWRPVGLVHFHCSHKERRRHLWRDYKKIYLWPADVFKKIRSNHKYGEYRTRRSANKRYQTWLMSKK